MTNEHTTERVESPSPLHAIDALLDGEPVEQQALRLALEDATARDYLVEALLLRQMTREMGPSRFAVPGTPASPLVRSMRWLAAGLILAVTAGTGYVYGQKSRAELAASGVEAVVDNESAPLAPEPTRSIRFEPGVNWTSGSRSH
jgi:hypothetical protein